MNPSTTPQPARAEDQLLELVAGSARGPRRDGLFALWLLLRVLQDMRREPYADRLQRRRVAALERRLASVTLPAPFRRAVTSAMAALATPATANPAVILAQLVAPVRESVNVEAGELLEALRAKR
ncbi:MAG TPA: hypothetical protein VFL88_06140 [Gemmatimonadales bacterium]|nr:hypothetical protein [Gemmatimonadales bacterium]